MAEPASRRPSSAPDGERAVVRAARALKTTRGRHEQGRFLIEGVRLVEEALVHQAPISQVFLTPHLIESTPRGRHLARWLRESALPLLEVSERTLALVSDTETPAGIIVVCALPPLPERIPVPGPGLGALLLDQVRDPGNMGAIVRTAGAAGLPFLVSTPGSVDFWAPKVVRAGAGAHFRLDLFPGRPEGEIREWLTDARQIVLADGTAPTSLYDLDWRPPTVLILGNEAHGPSSWLADLPVTRARIPMRGGTESLNVAAAVAIFLYEGRRDALRLRG